MGDRLEGARIHRWSPSPRLRRRLGRFSLSPGPVRRLFFSLLAVLLPALTPAAAAQLLTPFAGLFKSVNSVSIYGRAGQVPGGEGSPFRDTATFTGFGAELYLDLPRAGGWLFELGLGTSYGRGNGTPDPAYDLRISTRSLPAFALYATRTGGVPFVSPRLQPYATVQFGFVDLWNAQAYDDTGLPFDVDGEAYDLAYGAGLGFNLGPVFVYAEGTRLDRRFASIDYGAPDGEAVPLDWPRTLDLSGWVLSYGVQVRLQADAAGPPALAGSWQLAGADARPVPAPPSDDAAVVGGGLLFDGEGSDAAGRFTLWMLVRTAGGPIEERASCGAYRARADGVELLPQADPCPGAALEVMPRSASSLLTRDGDALLLPVPPALAREVGAQMLRFSK